jgi:putative ABC transport system permease protein
MKTSRVATVRLFLESLVQDLQYASRAMRRSPGFAAIAVLTLAVGIGVNAAVFTVTNAILFRGFPHADPQNRVLYLSGNTGTSYTDAEDWKAQAQSFTDIGIVANGGLRLMIADGNTARGTYDGTMLSANSFRVLDQRPMLGRDFLASDAVAGAPSVVILSYRMWEDRYAKNSSVIGRTIRINDDPATVIGVMPADFDFPHHRVDLWLPIVLTPDVVKRERRNMWFAFGRLADGVSVRSAQAEMETIGRRLEAAYPLTNRGVHPTAKNFRDAFNGTNATTLYGSLWGAVGFVLLIACTNLANFLLARAIDRSREISVRIAIGASRARIIRQLLLESITLSLVGGALGWVIATGCVRAYEMFAWPPGNYDRWHFPLDYTVLFYLLAISTLAGLLFGLAPALVLSNLDLNAALKDGGRGATISRGTGRLSTLLVAGEVALAVVVLAGAGVMIRSFWKVYTADIGVKTDHILTVSLRLPSQRYPTVEVQTAFFERVAAKLKSIPGVDSLALADSIPGLYAPRLPYELDGVSTDERSRPSVVSVTAGAGYFRTMNVTVISGREFTDFDGPSGRPVAMVNQQFANRIWPGQNPIGKRVRVFDGKTTDAWRTVIGVVPDIVQNLKGRGFEPIVYTPFRQRPAPAIDFLARTRVPPESLINPFRTEIQSADPDLVLYSGVGSLEGPAPLEESVVVRGSWSHGLNAGLFTVFAGIALLIASIGLYALVAHSLSRRTQEIGIRMALGASSRDVRELVFREGMTPVGIGLAVGLLISVAVNPLLQRQLVDVSPNDPIAMLTTSGLLMFAATLGCFIPAQGAVGIDPATSLRHE